MKFTAAVFFLLFLIPLTAPAGNAGPYFPGEELIYRITAMRFLSAGSAAFRVDEEPGPNGRSFYRLEVEAHSVFPFSAFFRVRNSMESKVDADTLLPVSFVKNRREAAFRRHISVEFDRDSNLALPDGERESFSVPPDVRDYLSVFYHIRGADLAPGESAVFTATGGRKTYDVRLEALRKETVYRRGRELDAIVFRSSISDFDPGGALDDDSREALIWITDDDLRLPLRMEIKAAFGNVTMMLIRYDEGERESAL